MICLQVSRCFAIHKLLLIVPYCPVLRRGSIWQLLGMFQLYRMRDRDLHCKRLLILYRYHLCPMQILWPRRLYHEFLYGQRHGRFREMRLQRYVLWGRGHVYAM
jgi:hypothetical protein